MPLISAVIPVYRDSERALATLRALLDCALPDGQALEIIVVDDGSADGTPQSLRAAVGERIALLENTQNLGRSATRNRGAAAARGELLLLLDCDCQPLQPDFLLQHLATLQQADVSIGALKGTGGGFWHSYQQAVAQRRAAAPDTELPLAFTTANALLRRQHFAAVGGFDERYRGYGFEDRDLALRLQRHGARFALTPAAAVRHSDALDLRTVCAKLQAAAGNGALFARQFPEAYRQLGYARVDARLQPWLRPLSHVLEPFRRLAIGALAPRLERRGLPFGTRRLAVRLLSAASYLRGSCLRGSGTAGPSRSDQR